MCVNRFTLVMQLFLVYFYAYNMYNSDLFTFLRCAPSLPYKDDASDVIRRGRLNRVMRSCSRKNRQLLMSV